ncbi:hypothetical protein KCP75_23430 [Salmonella enterica subsp. enterica]|nr:hypothetical protein KCP75_23430 [Salmonella enterica subsp. enterica]
MAKCFYYHWCDRHCCCSSTLYNNAENMEEAPYYYRRRQQRKPSLPPNRWAEPLPTPYFYLHQLLDAVLGITLWIPMVVNSSGYTDSVKRWSALYLTAVGVLANPYLAISDKGHKSAYFRFTGPTNPRLPA